jgi:hypothetical protein
MKLAATLAEAKKGIIASKNIVVDDVHDSVTHEHYASGKKGKYFGQKVTTQSGDYKSTSKGAHFKLEEYLEFYSQECTLINPTIDKSKYGTKIFTKDAQILPGQEHSSSYSSTISKSTYYQRSKQFWVSNVKHDCR